MLFAYKIYSKMIRRILLFAGTSIAVIAMATFVMFLVETVFGVRISGYFNGSYVWLLIFAAIYGFIGSFISLSISRWMAKKVYKMTLLTAENLHEFWAQERLVYDTVSSIATQNGIKIPEVGVYVSPDPNAFATGPSKNKSLVAVSTGLLSEMAKPEVEGVVWHEMAHILNGDMVTMTLLQGVINTFVIFFARIVAQIVTTFLRDDGESISIWIYYLIVIALEIAFGLIGMLFLMKFSRWREYRADAGSADYVGREKMLASLQKLQSLKWATKQFSDKKMATMKIADESSFLRLFSSHPPLEKRIERLSQFS